jgi:protein-L-isoaspartate(D-aspartate) O-methyltransferase
MVIPLIFSTITRSMTFVRELDATALGQALADARTELWTNVTIGSREPSDTLNLWLATVDDRFGMIWHDTDRDDDLVRLAARWYCPVLITADSFAYLTARDAHRDDQTGDLHHEFGVQGHGRHGAELAQQLHDHIQTWDRDRRQGPGPDFTLYPAETTLPTPAVGRVFPKRHTQLVMAWPD